MSELVVQVEGDRGEAEQEDQQAEGGDPEPLAIKRLDGLEHGGWRVPMSRSKMPQKVQPNQIVSG